MVERAVPRPVRPDVPPDPLTDSGPDDAVRDAARTGLYVHVPFCAVRCTYCHFATSAFEHGLVDRWLAAIEREAAMRAPLAAGADFTSVFLGGGTPSSLSARHVERLFAILRERFAIRPDAEVTLEANPESVRPALLEAWRRCGVNRLSLGAQTFEPAELRVLGRIHDEHRPGAAVREARARGFERVSLDLMFGWPGHTLAAFERSLAHALSLPIEHLSAYAFIPDAGNPLGDAVLAGRAHVAPDDEQADMYAHLAAGCERAGLRAYETSNFARPGAEARHNLTYWLRRDWVALGPSAHGLWNGTRWGNVRDTRAWAAELEAGRAPEEFRETPGEDAAAEEALMLALRLGIGLRPADHAPRMRAAIERRYGAALAQAVALGRLEARPGGWRVAPRHRFVADDVIAWIAARGRIDGGASAP